MEENNRRIKIIIADDHQLFRSGVVELISDYDFIKVTGEAADGEELVRKYFELKPDIILADISMPLLSGIEAVKRIKKTDPDAKVLFLSMYDGEEYVYCCFKAGAMGLINKNINREELAEAIKKISEGEKYFNDYTETELEGLFNKFEKRQGSFISEELTNREKSILNFISEGFTSHEIADKLKLSKRTIDTYRTNLIQKLHLRSLPDLIKYAIEFSVKNKGTY